MKRALVAAFLLALPAAAEACAVCGAAADRNRSAFLGTTILLSLLPLGLIAGGLWWIARRAGAHLAAELAERELPSGTPVGPGGGAGRPRA